MKLLYNANIINEGTRFLGYVLIDGDTIAGVGIGAPPEAFFKTADARDLGGNLLLPGAIDTHVHFRDPGLTHKADIASESAAAVAGGVTSFLDMPNTRPATVDAHAVDAKKAVAARSSYANYGFFIGATNDNLDQLLAADYSGIPGVKLFMGSSTGNMLVDDDSTLSRLFAEFPGVIAVHAEDEAIIRRNREQMLAELGENAPVAAHSLVRSRQACLEASRKAVELARRYNSRLHLLHISTADELALLSAGDIAQKRITAETCPHYLRFTAADLLAPEGFRRKCNPAIKGEADRQALIQAVADRRIDVIATDHAPHLLDEKLGSVFTAASGMPGVKFMYPLLLDMAAAPNAPFTIERVVELVAHNPATLYNIDRRGFISPGYYADLVEVRLDSDNRKTLTDSDSVSHLPQGAPLPGCRWTPYVGTEVCATVVTTYVNGRPVYSNGCVDPAERAAMPLKFN